MSKFLLRQRWMKGALGLAIALLIPACDNNQLPSFSSLLPTRQPLPSLPVQSPSTAEMETQVVQQINIVRQQQGLTQLRNNPKLAEVARKYSHRMAEQHFFSHTSPQGDTMVQRVQEVGIFYFMLGENLFTSTNIPEPVSAAVEGWMNSPGHRANILRSEYRETGVGVWREGNTYYVTQLFMRSL